MQALNSSSAALVSDTVDYVGKLCSFGSSRLGMKHFDVLKSLKFGYRDPEEKRRSSSL